MIRSFAYLLFAVGVVLAICGGAKMPPTATRRTFAEFEASLADKSIKLEDMRDVVLDQTRLVFRNAVDGDTSKESSLVAVTFNDIDDQQRAELLTRMEEKGVAFKIVERTGLPIFPDTLPLFIFGIATGVVGLCVWRWDLHRVKMAAAHGPKTDGSDPLILLADMIKPARQLEAEIGMLEQADIESRVDELMEKFVLPFAEHRHQITTRLGMSAGAEILVTAAVGERLLNRTWSAAGDGHLPEARQSYPEAVRAFEEAHRLAEQAAAS